MIPVSTKVPHRKSEAWCSSGSPALLTALLVLACLPVTSAPVREVDPNAAGNSGQGSSTQGPLPVSEGGVMRIVGRLDALTNGNACGIASKGHFAYLAMNESHQVVIVYDLSIPEKPKKIGYIPASGWPSEIKVMGDVGVTFSSRYNTMSAIDFTDPASPKVLKGDGGVPMLMTPRDKFSRATLTDSAVEGNLLFAPDGKGVKIWDITNPAEPAALGSVPSTGKFVVDHKRLYIQAGKAVAIYDIDDPKAPREVGRFEVPSLDGKIGGGAPAAANGRYLYLMTGGGTTVLEATTARVGGTLGGIAVVDVSDPANAMIVGTSFLEGVSGVFRDATLVEGRTLAVADSAFGLRVYDVGNPTGPRLIASDRRGGEVSAIGFSGDTLYVGQNLSGGVWVVDASDKSNPRAISYVHAGMEIWGDILALRNDYIYFCGHNQKWGGLHVADVRDPKNPKLVARLQGVESYGLLRNGNYLYVGNRAIVDIAQPDKPVVLPARLPSHGNAMQLVGDRLYMCASEAGKFAIVDVSKPAEPQLVGECMVGSGLHRCNRIHVEGNTVFLSGGTNLEGDGGVIRSRGLTVPIPPDKDPFSKLTAIDISDPTKPKVVKKWTLDELHFRRRWDDRINSVYLRNGNLFVTQYSGWTHAYAWKGPAESLEMIDRIKANYWTWLTVPDGKWLYCAKLMGLDIIEIVK